MASCRCMPTMSSGLSVRRMSKRTPEEREEERARRESVRRNYEFRPGAKKQRDEAERLDRGFKMLEEDDTNTDDE